jgi:hypothetical protein
LLSSVQIIAARILLTAYWSTFATQSGEKRKCAAVKSYEFGREWPITLASCETSVQCNMWRGQLSLINARSLLDHLVGATEQRQREGETERLGGLEIDNELDFCK